MGLRDRLKLGDVKTKPAATGHEIDKGVSIKKLRVRTRVHENRGVSPIISSIILTAMVLAIGAGVWGVATGASTVIQTNYYDEVMESVEKIKERFCIENMGVDSGLTQLRIWVFNYGPIDLTIDLIRVTGGNNVSAHSVSIPVAAGEFKLITLEPTKITIQHSLSVTIELRSNRGNKAYDSIRIP